AGAVSGAVSYATNLLLNPGTEFNLGDLEASMAWGAGGGVLGAGLGAGLKALRGGGGAASAEASVTEQQLDSMLEKAPAAKQEIDQLAKAVADENGGSVSEAPIKSRARALEKAENDYQGDASRLKDLARNTVVVPKGEEEAALNSLRKMRPDIPDR